ncbi:DUF4397 domain-containing protein [Filimonas effusa]|uniref:DUF4397 domain-containing protein n=2 Tax=Filimonas effusa TaxID=2508721 RepID=A0A4Q1DAI1_9BACT|nr:DUF4397 domain-containing protein [Filimonas effusa]
MLVQSALTFSSSENELLMYSKIFSGLLAASCMLMLGCKKNEFRTNEYVTPNGKAFVKVAYFSPYFAAQQVQVYINDERVSNTITTNHTPFPGGGYNTGGNSDNGYLSVQPDSKGTANIMFATPSTGTSIIAKELFRVSVPVTTGKEQVVFICDTAANTAAFTVDVDTERPDSGYARFNFVNCIPNSGPIDFYYADSLVASNIPYKGSKAFVNLPLKAAPVLKMCQTGTTTIIGAAYTFTNIGNQKIYSMLGRGYAGIASTDGQRTPKVSLVIVK